MFNVHGCDEKWCFAASQSQPDELTMELLPASDHITTHKKNLKKEEKYPHKCGTLFSSVSKIATID